MMKHALLLPLLFIAAPVQAQVIAIGCGDLSDFNQYATAQGLKVLRIEPVPETGNAIIIMQKDGPGGPVVAHTLIGDKQCVVFASLPLGPFVGITAKEAEPPKKAPPMPKPRVQGPDDGA